MRLATRTSHGSGEAVRHVEGSVVKWRPIETAPKDGTPFVAANRVDAFRAFYDVEAEVWVAEDSGKWFGTLDYPPTHWIRLPPPSPSRPLAAETEVKR